MPLPRTKTTILGIVCPKCTLHTSESVDVLFAHKELGCSHCTATIDIGSGEVRKHIEDVYLACVAADQANG